MGTTQWDTSYNATPASSSQPTGVDDQIRDLKENIYERLKKAHEWANASVDDDGWHLAGSAKAYFQSSAPTT